MQLSGYYNNFAAGELGQDARERSDMTQYASGCALAQNFIGLPSGPNASRGGFYDRGSTPNGTKARRVFPWLRGDGEGLVLEFGDGYARVWTARGVQLTSGGSPVSFSHPFPLSDLPNVRMHQVGDIAYVTSRTGAPLQVIKRVSDTSWSCGAYNLRDGPWLPENSNDDLTLTLTHVSGDTWNVVAASAVFLAGHVGATFRLRSPGGFPGYRSWAPNTDFTSGELVISAGRVYAAGATTKSGNTPPEHDRGAVSDGVISWTFQHDGAGIVQVTAYTDSTHVQVAALSTLPLASGQATSNWAECAFSSVQGWPTALAAVREERLMLAGSLAHPDVLFGSQTAGFDPSGATFKPGLGTGEVADDDAVRVGVGDKRARIVWMVDALNLVVGTTDSEHVVSGATVEDPLTPSGATPRRLSGHGSADVMPVIVQGPPILLLHAARGGTTLRELQLSSGVIEPSGRDLSILSQHLFAYGIKEMAWQRPDNILWIRLGNDTLAALTYHYEHGVLGVRTQAIAGGWLVEGLATSPDPDGRDILTIAAYRTKGGVQDRAHLVLAPRTDGMFQDCAKQYSGAPATVISGLSRLEGETVSALADGAYAGDFVVSGGAIHLTEAASQVTVGLKMLRNFRSLPLDPGRDGSMTSKKTRATHCWVSLRGYEAEVRAEPNDDPDETTIYSEFVSSRRPGDTVPTFRRIRDKVFLGTNADRDIRIVVRTDTPYDLVLDALRYVVDAQ